MNAQEIILSPEEQAELSRRVRSATISQRDGRRARLILLAAQGCSRIEIARLTGFSLPTITCWCQRFQTLRLDGLLDKPGRGRKASLPAETVCRVLEQVTQPRIGEPRWSCRSMRGRSNRIGLIGYGDSRNTHRSSAPAIYRFEETRLSGLFRPIKDHSAPA